MSQTIAISGKGGVGKTTIAALLIKYLAKHFTDRDVLIIDGDPASNIPEVLGLKTDLDKTISRITFHLKQQIEKGSLPPGYDKGLHLQNEIYKIIYEKPDYDVLILGRGEGKGCYCFINNLLKNILDPLEENYDIIFLDMEAGLEHFSRRTDRDVDELIIVTDMSKMGFNTMDRIVEISTEVHLNFKKYWIVGNRFDNEDAKSILEDRIQQLKDKFQIDIELIGYIPQNSEIIKRNLIGEALIDVPDENPAYVEAERMGRIIFKH
ncbi:MAG: AAA family ATPase [Candidatus Lokiarchaeota archaeon]|nr:AAA family ATPase [Candidatus Lokiarchaeota archaeon]